VAAYTRRHYKTHVVHLNSRQSAAVTLLPGSRKTGAQLRSCRAMHLTQTTSGGLAQSAMPLPRNGDLYTGW